MRCGANPHPEIHRSHLNDKDRRWSVSTTGCPSPVRSHRREATNLLNDHERRLVECARTRVVAGGRELRRWVLSASFVLPVVGAALLAWLLLRGQGEGVKITALVFVAGHYTLAAVEDMLREAHESAEDGGRPFAF